MNRTLILACGASLCAAPIALSPLYAQTAARAPAKAAAWKAPRNAFGQPDLGGFWTNATLTTESRATGLGNRLVYTPDEVRKIEGDLQADIRAGNAVTDPNNPAYAKGGQSADPGNSGRLAGAQSGVGGYNRGWLDPGSSVMRVNGEPRTSFLTTPDGRPPARKTAAAAAARGLNAEGGEGDDAAPARGGRGGVAPAAGRGGGGGRGGGFGGGAPRGNPEEFPLAERCIMSFGRNVGPPMLPNGFYNNNYRLVQGKDSVAIWVEMVHDVRVIRLNGRHRTDGVRPWGGDTIGRWEGETLVAETTNIPQAQAYSGSWENLTVTEKFTRVSPTRLRYQYIIKDPTAWDQPWGGEYEFDALPPGQGVYEYACHEGNYAMENMLAGARAEDRARAEAASGQAAR